MGTIQITTTPSITPNLRRAYTSLLDLAGWWAYSNKVAMLAGGWTMKWSCDGTTGPATNGDNTDRIASVANFATRATNGTTTAHSWFLVEGTDVQILVSYQGATDSVVRLAYSPTKAYVRAATPTFMPTATDETIVNFDGTVVGTATSSDRVMSIWSTATMWSCAVYRLGVGQSYSGVEKVGSLVATRAVNPIFPVPYVGYSYATFGARDGSIQTPGGGHSSSTAGTATYRGAVARVYTDVARTIAAIGGLYPVSSAVATAVNVATPPLVNEKPPLQNGEGSPLIPFYFMGPKLANQDGLLAVGIDWWMPITASTTAPAAGDQFNAYDPGDNVNNAPRANWLVAIGPGVVRPWRNAAVTMQTT